MNVLRRRGYVARVEFDGRDRVLVGRVLGIDDVVGFHADSVAMLEKAFAIALDDYEAACRRWGGRRSGAIAGSCGCGCRRGRTGSRRWRRRRAG